MKELTNYELMEVNGGMTQLQAVITHQASLYTPGPGDIIEMPLQRLRDLSR